MSTPRARARVFVVSLDEPLRPLEVGPGYFKAVLVVRSGRAVLGHVSIPALELLTVDVQRAAIAEQLAGVIWRREAIALLRHAFGVDERRSRPQPTVSVVVCTRDRPADLERCLASLAALTTPPHEVLVVDNAPSDGRARAVCDRFPVRYVVEPTPGQARARNRGIVETAGEVVAFTDDDCLIDPGWLDDLGAELDDPLVLCVTGYVGPAELETPSQLLFETHGGFNRGFMRRVFDGTRLNAAQVAGLVGAGANAIFRRDAFPEVGAFAEDLGPGTPACAADDNDMFCRILDAGYRIVFDPSRVVWHRHRRDDEALATLLHDYGVSSSAFVARRVGRHRDVSALRILAWWWLEHFPRALGAIASREPTRLPLRVVLGEVAGTFVGPWRLGRSRRSRRGIAEIAIPPGSASQRERPAVSVVAEWPSLSVVVPTRNRSALLRSVLAALGEARFPQDRLEAVVVLDGSTDDSAEVVRGLELPYRITCVETEQRGLAAARNRGVGAASEPVVLFLDDDTTPEAGCLAAHAALHARGDAEVVLAYCPPVVGNGWFEAMLRAWWEDHYRRKRDPGHRWTYADFVTGNTSLPRGLLESLGGFDEAFTARHEDWELGIRLLQRGTRLTYCPDAVAPHHLNTSLPTAIARQRLEGAGDVLLARKHPVAFGQLPLARFSSLPTVEPGELTRGLRAAGRFERLGLRTRWRRRVTGLFNDGYALGVRDELGSDAAFAELRAVAPPAVRVPVPVDGGMPLDLPSVGHVAFAIEGAAGRTVAEVEPVPPGRQWDWSEIVERVAREADVELRMTLVRREIDGERAGANTQAAASAPGGGGGRA